MHEFYFITILLLYLLLLYRDHGKFSYGENSKILDDQDHLSQEAANEVGKRLKAKMKTMIRVE